MYPNSSLNNFLRHGYADILHITKFDVDNVGFALQFEPAKNL